MRDFHKPGRSTVYAANGMCATSNPLAAKTAVSLLEAGGNAVDAAIGAAILLGFCEPQMTGLGGDCFVMIKHPDQADLIGLNGSGRGATGLSAAAMRAAGKSSMPAVDVSSVTIPGAVDAFCTLSTDYGRMPLADVLAPAIKYAEAGVPVGPRTAFDWIESFDNLRGTARDLFSINGAAPKPGQMFRAPGQAKVLRKIAAEGRAGFYEGEVAQDMVSSLRALGGTHELSDFAATACTYVEPVSTLYKGYELIEMPPNGQGATALLLANILSHFDLPSMDPFGAARAHVEAEATKLAYDARNRFLSDPETCNRLEHMLAPETASRLAALINLKHAMPDPHALSESVHKETIYITVVDKDRMAVSLIYSIFSSFGAGVASDKYGILFHDRGAGFSLKEGHPNEAGPGKRPMHTIIPAMLKEPDGSLLPFGVMGGAYQATGHARFLTNTVDYGMHPQETIDSPRCFAEAEGLKVERGYSEAVRQELTDLGHNVFVPVVPIGGAQAIRIDVATGVLEGGSDPRKDGCALGY